MLNNTAASGFIELICRNILVRVHVKSFSMSNWIRLISCPSLLLVGYAQVSQSSFSFIYSFSIFLVFCVCLLILFLLLFFGLSISLLFSILILCISKEHDRELVCFVNINNIIYVTDSLLYWAEPLACLSLLSIMSWIRPDTRIWKLALSQPCSSRIKNGQKRDLCSKII